MQRAQYVKFAQHDATLYVRHSQEKNVSNFF